MKDLIPKFCYSVKSGFGTITDSAVKKEFERIYECSIDTRDLADLLALLEKHQLLDKKNSVNKELDFYQKMRKKL